MNEVLNFLTDNPTFYLATLDGNEPKVRPFGFIMEYEGKLYFCTSNTKNVSKQLKANPNFEISTTSDSYEWIRLKGQAIFDSSIAAKTKAFEAAPFLADTYQTPENPLFQVFYIQNGEATFYSMKGETKHIKL